MKTKIIYISGGEFFKMADIQGAFDEVRKTLNLGNDTIMFGIPVDADDAFAGIDVKSDATDVTMSVPGVDTADTVAETVGVEPVAPVKKSRKRTAKAKEEAVATIPEYGAPASAIDETPAVATANKVVSILSVLTSGPKKQDDNIDVVTDSGETTDNDKNNAEDDMDDIITELTDVDDFVTMDSDENDDAVQENAPADADILDEVADENKAEGIDNRLTEDIPTEKTLEELLKTMPPLDEDTETTVVTDVVATESESISDSVADTDEDTDATLARLATEFVHDQDKIDTKSTKSGGRGRIGKLRNILPFKKNHTNDDTGLIGDLFGWAGVAANDDDFTVPGFFANAASKK